MSDIKLEFTNNTWINNDDTVTVKHISNEKQVHYNSNIRNHISNYRKHSKNSYINTATGEVITYKQNDEKVPKYVAREVAKGKDILIHHFSGHQNVLFFTLTFAEACMDIKDTQKYFNRFLKKLETRYGKLIYFYVIELQKERKQPSLHIHAAIKSIKHKRFRVEKDEAENLWGKGFVTSERLYDVQKISTYFFKDFFREENLKIYPKNSHICYHSQGLKPPIVEKLSMSDFLKRYGDSYYLDNSTANNVIDSKTKKVMCSNIYKYFKPKKYKRKTKKRYKHKRAVRFIKIENGKMICDDIYTFKKRCMKYYNIKITLDTKNTILMSKVKKLKKRKKYWILIESTFPLKYKISNATIIDILDEKDVIKKHLF